jgi:hypothetical protein
MNILDTIINYFTPYFNSLKEVFTGFNGEITPLLVFFFLIMTYALVSKIKSYTKLNEQEIKKNLKDFQLFCDLNKNVIFIITNVLIYVFNSYMFDPICCLITHMFLLDLLGLLYLLNLLKVPLVPILVYIGIASGWITSNFINDLATGGVPEPGTSAHVVKIQMETFGVSAPTAVGGPTSESS